VTGAAPADSLGEVQVLVAGGTGTLGSAVTDELLDRGHVVAVVSRRATAARVGVVDVRADLARGAAEDVAAVRAAMEACEGSIDVTNVTTTRRDEATEFFTRVAEGLRAAGVGTEGRHHVVTSIVGIDGVPFGYYQGKVAHEHASRAPGATVSVVRATQFHEFAGQVADAMRVGPLRMVPRMRCRPVATREVAAVVVDRLLAGPVDRPVSDEVAGPREEQLPRLVRSWCAATGIGGRVVGVPLPGAAGRAFTDGTLCPHDVVGRGPTFDEWLATRT
jgi:uncharacterized protein YbjT (DUF2867 family)